MKIGLRTKSTYIGDVNGKLYNNELNLYIMHLISYDISISISKLAKRNIYNYI